MRGRDFFLVFRLASISCSEPVSSVFHTRRVLGNLGEIALGGNFVERLVNPYRRTFINLYALFHIDCFGKFLLFFGIQNPFREGEIRRRRQEQENDQSEQFDWSMAITFPNGLQNPVNQALLSGVCERCPRPEAWSFFVFMDNSEYCTKKE